MPRNGRSEIPDAKASWMPANLQGDASPAAADATWGLDHSLRPMHAGEVVLVDRNGLIATFTLHLFLGGGIDLYIRGWRLVRWGPNGERVFAPQCSHRVSRIYPPEVLGGEPTVKHRTSYEEILLAGSNRGAAAFEAAALSAARVAVARARRELVNGNGVDHDDSVPF